MRQAEQDPRVARRECRPEVRGQNHHLASVCAEHVLLTASTRSVSVCDDTVTSSRCEPHSVENKRCTTKSQVDTI